MIYTSFVLNWLTGPRSRGRVALTLLEDEFSAGDDAGRSAVGGAASVGGVEQVKELQREARSFMAR